MIKYRSVHKASKSIIPAKTAFVKMPGLYVEKKVLLFWRGGKDKISKHLIKTGLESRQPCKKYGWWISEYKMQKNYDKIFWVPAIATTRSEKVCSYLSSGRMFSTWHYQKTGTVKKVRKKQKNRYFFQKTVGAILTLNLVRLRSNGIAL